MQDPQLAVYPEQHASGNLLSAGWAQRFFVLVLVILDDHCRTTSTDVAVHAANEHLPCI